MQDSQTDKHYIQRKTKSNNTRKNTLSKWTVARIF